MAKEWKVYVRRDDKNLYLGSVSEINETHARHAALSQFGVNQDEIDAGEVREKGMNIFPEDSFSVSPA
ncbi:hypothetical protein [Eoetvoesiella caeni]